MKKLGRARGRWTLGVAAWLCAAGAVGAQEPTPYTGRGYWRQVEEAGPVGTLAFGDFQDDGNIDLASCRAGTLTIYDWFGDYDAPEEIPGVDFVAATHEGTDHLWTVQGTSVSQVIWTGDSLEEYELVPSGIDVTGAVSVFRSQDCIAPTDGGEEFSVLMGIDNAGQRARFWKIVDGVVVSTFTRTACAELQFYDLAVLYWDSDDTLDCVTYGHQGARVVEPTSTGFDELEMIAGEPEDAFLDVRPDAGSGLGDLLFCQRRAGVGQPLDLVIQNAAHEQVLPDVTGLGLRHVYFADLTSDPATEVIMPLVTNRLAGILAQEEEPTPTEMFWINYDETTLIDLLMNEPPQYSTMPPAVAVGDANHDGDDDVLFADDRGKGMVITSPKFPEDNLRVHHQASLPNVEFPEGASSTFQITHHIAVPPNTGQMDVELWYQWVEGGPAHYHSRFENCAHSTSSALSFTGIPTQPVTGAYPAIYQVLYRTTDSQTGKPRPVRVDLWSPDMLIYGNLITLTFSIYHWLFGGDEGGTVQRPHISPGGGTGPH